MNGSDKNENLSDKDENLDEDSILDFKSLCNLRQGRLESVLSEKYQYNTSVDRGQKFLLPHVNSKVDLVIMYADIVGSTKMSMTLPTEKVVTIIKAFSHELSSVIESYGGFVLKYVGDAIISFFPSGFNKYLICDRAYICAKSMLSVLRNDINPVFRRHNYPDLQIKIGMAEGENIVIQYGKDKSSQIDLIGYVMNVASKITSLTSPNRISLGGAFYGLLHPKTRSEFEKVSLENRDWKYIDKHNQKTYEVYTTKFTH
ncbi:MAG: adenylate/guanylate cyclase domain-containing protein [Candidatus Nitrosocosmicus sp.]|jgi:class 3 adenylate cyclase|uniref:adenylate/guanylate cyclase domain-containing protein n=1 Tax=Candidatus Nitrosocosmicus agrestis TaxID=2563600 RepID=UPI0013316809|nr:adenylate/guanylate cyclase domain-containing protein [Candidatus Nitrosocosmicus sp. SS]MDR4490418.1 adenylate/guanylate cyclase domain-containing protein [Candidatus Nitrosocosmicus sp.]